MKQSTDKINKIKKYVISDLVANYQLDTEQAKEMVEKSAFNQMLADSYEFVVHYNSDYWAKDVYEEFRPFRAVG